MTDMLMNWAVNYHVDGFRFDATSVMGADEALIEINKDLRSHKETQSLILYPEDMRMLVEMANNTAGKEINKDNWGYNGLTTFDFFKAITSNVTGQQINDFKPHPKTLSKIFKKGVYKYKDEQKGLKDISYTTIFKLPTGKIDINGKEITEAKAVRRNLSEVSRMFPNNFLINVSNHDEIGNFPGGKRNMVSILATRLGIYDNRVKENRDTANSSSKASNLLFELVKNYAKTGMVLDESTQIKMGCMKPISQKEMDREFHNSFELNKVMLGTMFLHPSPKEFFMGDDLGELAPFKFFVNVPLGDAKFKKSIEKEKGYSVGKDTFDEAKLNTDKYNIKWVNDATLKFSQDFIKVLEQNATLKSRNFENISTHEHKDKNALEINYFDKNTGEEVVAVINFSDKAHINFPLYTISSSKVEELINSTSSEYGGENFYQNSKNSSSKNLEIPPHSIIVFKKN